MLRGWTRATQPTLLVIAPAWRAERENDNS